ncbi:hypothetical protein F7725_026237 [Dissostichus mawsoni]|uniref:Uncharacterized protein n=1 Tax=Dissostichus mawsoni TaxID=36200 RepID=A0A7J5X6H2_DISMA|nr:hypothetical protein F7725_026237 [Dissostichus mawsoni]
MCTGVALHYLSGRVYDITESSGGRGVFGINSTQHLLHRLFQPQHHRCLPPEAVRPPDIQRSQFSQGRGLPADKETLTSRKHDESVLQQLVGFVSFFLTFFRIHIFQLTEMEMAKCSGECKVWQLRQISVLLKSKNKSFLYQTGKVNIVYMHTLALHSTLYLPLLV